MMALCVDLTRSDVRIGRQAAVSPYRAASRIPQDRCRRLQGISLRGVAPIRALSRLNAVCVLCARRAIQEGKAVRNCGPLACLGYGCGIDSASPFDSEPIGVTTKSVQHTDGVKRTAAPWETCAWPCPDAIHADH